MRHRANKKEKRNKRERKLVFNLVCWCFPPCISACVSRRIGYLAIKNHHSTPRIHLTIKTPVHHPLHLEGGGVFRSSRRVASTQSSARLLIVSRIHFNISSPQPSSLVTRLDFLHDIIYTYLISLSFSSPIFFPPTKKNNSRKRPFVFQLLPVLLLLLLLLL